MTETLLQVCSDLDIVRVRGQGRDIARSLGFGTVDQVRIVTAISELARNIVLYAGEGTVLFRIVNNLRLKTRGLEIVFEDAGPGIEDISLAMQDGYSTSQGRGLGLAGAQRLMDEFEIESKVGQGTKITIRKWLGK